MNMQLIQKIQNKFMKKVPVLKPGNTVRVHQKIKEGGKERIQIFEGLVIAVNSGSGTDKTFTVRKGSIGVEKIFPLYSKNITKIQVTKEGNIRRSKLYYMRKRSGKSARLREKHLAENDVRMEDFEETVEETPVTTEAPVEAEEKPAEEAPKEEEKPAEEVASVEEEEKPAEEEAPKEEEKPE